MINLGMPEINIDPKLLYGLGAAVVGFMLLLLFMKAVNTARMIEVPDGIAADQHYRDWRNSSIGRRIGRGWLFVTFLGMGLMLGGCGVVLVGVL